LANSVVQVATVTSAVQLENEQQFLIAKKLQEMTGAKNIKLKPQVDAALIGGFVVTYGVNGSSQIDMSVSGQINKVASSMGISVAEMA
jgi:F-type H+-transporting ATPase subunit delta